MLVLSLAASEQSAVALPIGFGYNQGSLEFQELKSKNFTVYHDKRAPEDAKLALRSLEAARPSMERWFKTSRTTPLIVNMSAASDNASFANFITDSIELQTLGQGGRDLAWHEYTHATMYRHMDNWFGPAGAMIHLPWMEAWFLEGLAEAVSVSVGSDEQAGIERFQALTNSWPSWDRIHSLYTSGPFNFRGYATSGAFVSWILRYKGAESLPDMLDTFRSKSMPWYWPWGILPFNSFLPMDSALRDMTGKNGKELYEQYKIDATARWKGAIQSPVLALEIKKNETTKSPWAWQFRNKSINKIFSPDDAVSAQFADTPDAKAWVSDYYPKANQRRYRVVLSGSGKRKPQIINRRDSYWIDGPWLTPAKVFWLETFVETIKLCEAPRQDFKLKSVTCRLTSSMPEHLRLLGNDIDETSQTTRTLWLSRDREHITGDTHEIIELDLTTGIQKTLKSPVGGRPVSIARTPRGTWVLTGDRAWRHIVRLDGSGACEGIVEISDHPVRILSSDQDLPIVVLYTADGYGARQLNPARFPVKPCRAFSQRTSPLLAA